MENNQDLNRPSEDNTLEAQPLETAPEQRPAAPETAPEPAAAPQAEAPAPKSCRCNGTACLIACNIVLLIGLVLLYIFHFAGIGTGTPSRVNDDASEPYIAEDGQLKIAYVDSDSLLAKYDYAKDLQRDLEAYKDAQERNYKEQMTKFQNDYQNYLKTGADLTLTQQQAKEAELKARAEKLSTLEQELAYKMTEKQVNANIELLNRIFAFVRDYNAQNQQFDIIMRKTFTDSPTMYMNPAMDITDEIIEGLNKEYKEVKGKKNNQ